MWQPVTPAQVADDHPSMLANHMRALQREMRDGFDGIGRALVALTRIESRLDVVIERQNLIELRQDAIERRQAESDRRLAALELPAARVVRSKKAK
jgi:hypothetical protein